MNNDSSKKEQAKYAEDMGYHASSLNLLSNPPSTAAFNQLDKIVSNMEHRNGATHTEKYGDMRTYNGARAANQRASNTRLLNTVGAAAGHSNDTSVGVSGPPSGPPIAVAASAPIAVAASSSAKPSLHNFTGYTVPGASEDEQMKAAMQASLRYANRFSIGNYPQQQHHHHFTGFSPPSLTPVSKESMTSGVSKTPATPAHVEKVLKAVLHELMIDTDSMRVSELIQIEKSLRKPYNQSLVEATESLAEMNKTIPESIDALVLLQRRLSINKE